MINFVTFGSDQYYQKLAKKTLDSLNKIYSNSKKRIFSVEDLSQEVLENAEKYRRGFGYYFWKPFIYKSILSESNLNDIILYFDSRCGLSDSLKDKLYLKIRKIQWFNFFIKNDQFDIAVWQLSLPEEEWTTGDIFDILSVNLNSDHAKSGQFTDIFFAVRKNPKTEAFFKDLESTVSNNSYVCSPEDNNMENSKVFKESRYIQSFFSLMLKLNKQELNIYKFSGENLKRQNSILPHMYRHEGNKRNLT